MRAFIIAILTLTLVFGLIIWNFFYINNIYVNMAESVTELKADSSSLPDAKRLYEYWKSKQTIIALSVPHRISDEIERNLVSLIGKLSEDTPNDFEEARLLTLNSIEEMIVHAGISADSIF